MNRARLSASLAATWVAVTLVACGSGSDPTGTAADGFIREYCNLTAKCCEAGRNDPAECASSFSQFQAFFPRRYDAAKATACLAKLREAKDCDFDAADADCQQVFGDSAKSGAAAPGSPCQSSADCAASSEGRTGCNWSSSGGGKCQLTIDGAEGAVCDGTRSGIVTSYVGSDVSSKDKLVICDRANDLVCNQAKVCFKLGDIGATCATTSECKSGLCQQSKCIARAEIGASCATTSCVDGAYCDSQQQVCVAKLAPGFPCTSFTQCKNGGCDAGVCGSASSSPPLGCFSGGG